MCTDRDSESRPRSLSKTCAWLALPLTICLTLLVMLPAFKGQPAPTVPKVEKVTTADFDRKVLQSKELTLVWISDTHTSEPALPPGLAVLADEMPVVRIERTQCALISILLPDLNQLQLRGQSSYVLVKDGKAIANLVPVHEAPAEQLLYFVRHYKR